MKSVLIMAWAVILLFTNGPAAAQFVKAPASGRIPLAQLYGDLPTDGPAAFPRPDTTLRLATPQPETALSPLDTLHMSLLEKIFWGRRGFFRGTGIFRENPDNPSDDLRQIAHIRRKMLSWHQALGLATVASMTVTVIGGQRAYDGHDAGLHTASLPFTIGLYAATATLALTSPPKLVPGHGRIDTITFHKAFAVLHLAGMILTPMFAEESGEGSGSRLGTHRALGYATYAAFAAGMITVTLFR